MESKHLILLKKRIKTIGNLSLLYTPGVGAPCLEIAKKKELVFEYTSCVNIVAVISDGSAVLGLGNIGPEAGLPAMEGTAVRFKEFGVVDAFPMCLATQKTDEIIAVATALAFCLGGINPEDISALKGADIFIGASGANLIIREDVRTMAGGPIIFAITNPDPEILPDGLYL